MPYQWIWSLTTAKGFCFVYMNYLFIYYIKVSGIPSGNKLIKTIRYPHMWRYDILTCEDVDNFTDTRFVSQIVLKFVGVPSKHLRVFLESARQSSEIFGHLRKFSGKCSGTFVWSSGQFEKSLEIFGRWSEIFGKSTKTPSSVCLYNKQNNTWTLGDMEFMWTLEDKFHISARPCIILFITSTLKSLAIRAIWLALSSVIYS